MISVVITDDELLARHRLGRMLRDEPDIRVLGEASSGQEMVELAQLAQPDLIFLDVQMPGLNGLEALEALGLDGEIPPRIIFTTAHDQYAARAFDLRAVDYLLKPYSHARLQQALNRARHEIIGRGPAQPGTRKDEQKDRLIFKSGGRIVFLPIHEIWTITAEENYLRIATANESHLLRETMSRFETRLDPRRFLRIHRSTIVNVRYVKEMKREGPRGDLQTVMANGRCYPVSRGYRSKIAELVTGSL